MGEDLGECVLGPFAQHQPHDGHDRLEVLVRRRVRHRDGLVELLDENAPDERLSDVRHAAAICPASAIEVRG